MKFLAVIALTLFSLQSLAKEKAVFCTNQVEFGEDDNYIGVQIDDHGIEFNLHETFFKVPNPGFAIDGRPVQFIDEKEVQVFAEGEETTEAVRAFLIHRPAKKKLSLVLSVGSIFRAATLECNEVEIETL